MLGRRSLLEERLVLRAVYVALEHDRPPRNPAERSLGHRQIVLYQVELRVAGVWKEYLVRVGDHHVAACGFQDGVHEEGAWSTSLVDGAPEPLRSSGAGARGLNLAIARLASSHQRTQKIPGHRRDLFDGVIECRLVDLRRLVEPRDLSHELDRSSPDLLLSRGRVEVKQRLDVPAHSIPSISADARGGAREKQLALAGVAREQRRSLKLCTRLVQPAELCQKVAARTRYEMVTLQ